MPVELSYKPMIEAIIFFWKHCVLERPKQLEIGGKENYCRILLFKNAQYGKYSQKENWYGRFSWKKSAKEFVFSKLQIYSIYFTNRGLLFKRFLWNTLKLLVLILFRTSLGCYYLCWKTCKEQSDYYLLTGKILKTLLSLWKFYRKFTIAPRFVLFWQIWKSMESNLHWIYI